MLYATILIFVLLTVKSIWIDPVKDIQGEAKEYYDFIVEANEENYKGLLKPPIIAYKVVDIYHNPSEEDTIILEWDSQEGQWEETSLQGKYGAKIKAYLFHILPYKQFKVQGGIENVH